MAKHSENEVLDEYNDENSGVTATLCNWIVGLEKKDIPDEVLERAKHLILDGIACGLVGARVPWSESAVDAILAYAPEGQGGRIGYEEVSIISVGTKCVNLANNTFRN